MVQMSLPSSSRPATAPDWSTRRRGFRWLCSGLVLAMAWAATPAISRVGSGRAYNILGDLPVKHRDRVKPLDSMAIEEVKIIYGRDSIALLGHDGKAETSWNPVAALVDWSARPEFWDEQDLILVENLPLERLLLEASAREQLLSLAEKEMPAVRSSLEALASQPALSEVDLRAAAVQAGETSTTGRRLKAMAVQVGEGRKRLSPRVLETAEIRHEGRTLKFPLWVGEIMDKVSRDGAGRMGAAPNLTPLEEKAVEVGERLVHYQALRDHTSPPAKLLDLAVAPRPFSDDYRMYSGEVFEKGMKPDQTLSPLEANVAGTLVEYLQSIPNKDWALPGEDAVFDQQFSIWLDGQSSWIPLGVILESDEAELSRAGFPPSPIAAFRKSYRDLEEAERASPGNASDAAATAVIEAARSLGTSLGNYPESAVMTRESRLNRLAPFSKAATAYGFGLMLLLLSLGIAGAPRTASGNLSSALYFLGMAGLAAGTALVLYGLWTRFRLAHWGPVTSLYESVVFLALATSMMGLALELLWRRKYFAISASGVAFLAILLAENTPVLDPNMRAILPALRFNRWIVGHVLTSVSSYAAFALALNLGLLAVGYYLTATYRRSPTYRELAWPLLPGIPLCVLGRLGIASTYRLLPPSVLDPQLLHHASFGLAATGGVLTILGGFSLLGELANRSPRRVLALGIILAVVGAIGLTAGTAGAVHRPLADALSSYDAWLPVLVGGALIVMSLLAVQAEEIPTRIETLADFIYRTMLVGVLLLAAGTIVGGVWAHRTWGRFWGWDPKEVWALITLLVYLAPLCGRFTGRLSTFGLVAASVVCSLSILMSWYGLNFLQRVGLHNYGFTEGDGLGIVTACTLAVLSVVGAAAWRRSRAQ